MQVQTLTDTTLDEFVETAANPVLVDFWAPWCGPCRLVSPVLDELAAEMAGSLVVAKVNVDENPDLVARFGVQTMPTLKVFVDGAVKHTILGAKPRGQLVEELSPFLASAR